MQTCNHCGRQTNVRWYGLCIRCKEAGITHRTSKKGGKNSYRPIDKGDGLNKGKACYADYLKESKWDYAQSFKKV